MLFEIICGPPVTMAEISDIRQNIGPGPFAAMSHILIACYFTNKHFHAYASLISCFVRIQQLSA